MKNYILAVTALFLLASTSAFAQRLGDGEKGNSSTNPGGPRLKMLQQFSFQRVMGPEAKASTIAFGQNRVYVSSPDSVVLAAPALNSSVPLAPIFQPQAKSVDHVYVYDNDVYVLTSKLEGDNMGHTHYKSSDGGQSFFPIDHGLQDCSRGVCVRLASSELFAKDNFVFINAGGGENLLVSNNSAISFLPLSGGLFDRPCYHNTFEIVDRTVLMGGECKLDDAFLKRGLLSEDKLALEVPMHDVQSPDLGNRKMNAIKQKPGTSLVLAANEGALLRSVDGGQSFTYAFEYPTDSPLYPYTGTILFPNSRPDLAFIGGWDKGSTTKPYLAYSANAGKDWRDISYLLKHVNSGVVTQLAEDNHGRPIAVVVDVTQKTVSIFEVQMPRSASAANASPV